MSSRCGPAKGYIEGLEHRLHEAESLLLSLLPLVTTEQLNCATDSLNATSSATHILNVQTRDSQSPGPRNVRSSPPVLNKKTGIEYWDSFPLDTVDNIRKWQDDCAIHSGTGQSQASFRNSISGDDSVSREMIQNAFHSAHNSRPGSVDLSAPPPSHSRAQSGALPSMSTDSYRSGTSTPVHVPPRHAHSQSTIPSSNIVRQIPTASQQQQQQQQQQQPRQQNWNSMSLFSSLSAPSGATTTTNTPNSNVNNVDLSNEALLLQSFADSTWAQSQSLNNNGMGNMTAGLGTTNNNMIMESGPMEVDTGFFGNDVQRSLFW
ncbi:hypothetical protein H2204_015036 [Knufia peltigerae]|uniref:Uncharacterized protein n=1 Tax=Knufia peltigerae TaxID=1002370 RepID=A0AA38XFV7_9EURO|nr:hypothetical protein H2204_015036 [Knufia peltigerae]